MLCPSRLTIPERNQGIGIVSHLFISLGSSASSILVPVCREHGELIPPLHGISFPKRIGTFCSTTHDFDGFFLSHILQNVIHIVFEHLIIIKVATSGNNNFQETASPQCNVSKLRILLFSLCSRLLSPSIRLLTHLDYIIACNTRQMTLFTLFQSLSSLDRLILGVIKQWIPALTIQREWKTCTTPSDTTGSEEECHKKDWQKSWELAVSI